MDIKTRFEPVSDEELRHKTKRSYVWIMDVLMMLPLGLCLFSFFSAGMKWEFVIDWVVAYGSQIALLGTGFALISFIHSIVSKNRDPDFASFTMIVVNPILAVMFQLFRFAG